MKKILKNFIFLPLVIVAALAIVFIQVKSKQAIEHMLQQFKHHTQHKRARGIAKAKALLQQAWINQQQSNLSNTA